MSDSEDPWLRAQREKALVSGQPWMFFGAISTVILLAAFTFLSDGEGGWSLTVARLAVIAVFIAMIVVRFAVPVARLSRRRRILQVLLAVMLTSGVIGMVLVAIS